MGPRKTQLADIPDWFRSGLEIDHCDFPDNLLYDTENNTWVRIVNSTEVVVGINTLLSAIAGRLVSARLKAAGTPIQRGRSLGTLESLRFVGPIPSPISGTIVATNEEAVRGPKIINNSPYDQGWIAKLEPLDFKAERVFLQDIHAAGKAFRGRIAEFRARCFKAYPDHEMVEIGVECAAVLVRLNELVANLPVGDVVHIVSDDPTAYVEMVRWVDQTGQSLAEWRTEGNLFHFIVRKIVPMSRGP